MVSVIRTKNPSFSSGTFPPWMVTGDVEVSGEAYCTGFFAALFAGDGTGMISQTNQAYPNRSYRLLMRVGSCGGAAGSPIQATVEFLNSAGRVLRRVQFTVDETDIPDICNATPAPCLELDLSVGISPSHTNMVRLTIAKPEDDGADIVVDSIYLIESTL